MEQFLMARQPIYDRSGVVFAYEILYRSTRSLVAGEMDESDDVQALANTLVEIGLDRLVGDRLAFINVPASLIHSDAMNLLPPKRVMLELLETLVLDEQTSASIDRLRAAGYQLAFDDFIFEPSQFGFLEKVGLVKVDVLATPNDVLRRRIPELKRRGLKLLAEKVESKAMHRQCMALGFDLFQGYYYARPETLSSRGLPPSRQVMVSLLAKLQDPDASLGEVEQLITADASLAFSLLKLVNSAGFGLSTSVSSIKVAVAMLGLAKVQAVASLLTMSTNAGESPELLSVALIRARMCERIAGALGFEDPNKHFTVGLFSVLDALLDAPMSTIVELVPLDADLRAALLDPESDSDVGGSLRRALAFERGEWDAASAGIDDPACLGRFYAGATAWARELERVVAAA